MRHISLAHIFHQNESTIHRFTLLVGQIGPIHLFTDCPKCLSNGSAQSRAIEGTTALHLNIDYNSSQLHRLPVKDFAVNIRALTTLTINLFSCYESEPSENAFKGP